MIQPCRSDIALIEVYHALKAPAFVHPLYATVHECPHLDVHEGLVRGHGVAFRAEWFNVLDTHGLHIALFRDRETKQVDC